MWIECSSSLNIVMLLSQALVKECSGVLDQWILKKHSKEPSKSSSMGQLNGTFMKRVTHTQYKHAKCTHMPQLSVPGSPPWRGSPFATRWGRQHRRINGSGKTPLPLPEEREEWAHIYSHMYRHMYMYTHPCTDTHAYKHTDALTQTCTQNTHTDTPTCIFCTPLRLQVYTAHTEASAQPFLSALYSQKGGCKRQRGSLLSRIKEELLPRQRQTHSITVIPAKHPPPSLHTSCFNSLPTSLISLSLPPSLSSPFRSSTHPTCSAEFRHCRGTVL